RNGKQKAKVSFKENQMKYQPKVTKPKKWGNILITRVYFVEGLGQNLFSVGQFCDSDLEVAFRRDACFVRNLEGVDLLKGDRSTNLYTINLYEMASASPICLMARAFSTKSQSSDIIRNIFVLPVSKAIATACFTQNRSIIHRRFNKTPYELINDRKPDISFLQVFGALYYPKNDREDIGKLGARTKKIIETMNVSFDELSAMAFKQRSSKPELQSALNLLFEAMYDDYIGGQSSATGRTVPPAQEPQVRQTSTASTTIADIAPTPTNSSSLATNILITSQDVDELNSNAMVDGNTFVNPFANSSSSAA
nr:retrovirus-related Pol polyprotein from transposon TNT 1-94 [Tanacetum cinerariifolium]